MTPVVHFDSAEATVWHGDCIEVMRGLPDASVDAVVTDPPYGLEFMGKDWDRPWSARGEQPAGAGLTTGGFSSGNGYADRKTPSYGKPWMLKRCKMCGHTQGGGSPCRCDEPVWLIERQHPAIPMRGFQSWCEEWATEALRVLKPGGHMLAFGGTRTFHRLTAGIEDAGFEIRDSIAWLYGSGFPKSRNLDGDWKGWGTALKPAFEPIVVARRPLAGTVQSNVEQHGTGALNIAASRIGTGEDSQGDRTGESSREMRYTSKGGTNFAARPGVRGGSSDGRWPANVILDGSQTFDEARYFYTAKAGADERPAVQGVAHPTVKPLDLMQWLVRLVTPRGGTVLEPFAGSGTTIEACVREGFRCVAIEREETYLPLIMQRVKKPHAVGFDFGDWAAS